MGSRGCRAAQFAGRRGSILTALLLDTNVLIEAERVMFDLDSLIDDDDEPAVAAITIAELGVGVHIAFGKRKAARKSFLDEIVRRCRSSATTARLLEHTQTPSSPSGSMERADRSALTIAVASTRRNGHHALVDSGPEVFRHLPFPFEGGVFPANLGALVQRTVLDGDEPAREVVHAEDGSWLVGDGVNDPNPPGASVVTHIAHVIERNSSVASLADMPLGHIARRSDPADPWLVTVHHWEDE